MTKSKFKIEKTWGEVVEDRGSQITYSALGQEAHFSEKKKYDPDYRKRKGLKKVLDKLIYVF